LLSQLTNTLSTQELIVVVNSCWFSNSVDANVGDDANDWEDVILVGLSVVRIVNCVVAVEGADDCVVVTVDGDVDCVVVIEVAFGSIVFDVEVDLDWALIVVKGDFDCVILVVGAFGCIVDCAAVVEDNVDCVLVVAEGDVVGGGSVIAGFEYTNVHKSNYFN